MVVLVLVKMEVLSEMVVLGLVKMVELVLRKLLKNKINVYMIKRLRYVLIVHTLDRVKMAYIITILFFYQIIKFAWIKSNKMDCRLYSYIHCRILEGETGQFVGGVQLNYSVYKNDDIQ